MYRLSFILILTFLVLGEMSSQSLDFEHMEGLKWRNIGPAGMSGRVTAIDVNLRDKDHIYIGAASGGVWASKNGGITWEPLFDEQPTQSIGALEINQANPDEIWVGTGEGNPRNSHNSGQGVFKSVDGGKTWSCMGLKKTKLIHRIIVNSSDTESVLVGAMGSAWGPSSKRGVYRTKDGGKTWKQTLYVEDNVGIADMVADPSNPNKIIAAMWEFGRKPWTFNSGGEGSGLYISYDGGDNWKKLTEEEGLPKGHLGRMGIAFAPSNPEIVYALIEAKQNGLYKSTDGGENWHLVSSKNIGNRPFYYAELYVDPQNENRIYNLWSYVSMSEDGGKTFKTIADYGNNIHPDHHAFWIDPDDSNYLIDGNDGGLNISRDGAKTWRFVTNLPLGQFYHVDVDDDYPYNVYGGMQDNGSWVGPGFVLKQGGIINHDWQELYFGDGFDVAPRKDDNRYGYAMSQQGNIGLWDKLTGRTEYIQPQHPEGETLRYNWNAALALDPYSDNGLYYGSQYVHYSSDQGKSWQIISPDLTTNDTIKQNQSKSGGLTLDITGAENYTTILAIAPCPHDKETIWASTDDGNLHITRDGGDTWTDISSRLKWLPTDAWLPQIELSTINKGEAFVVANNYRQNDWTAFLYHTTDYGKSWSRLVTNDDVDGFVCSVVQDPKHEDLLFLGTDVGLYFSLDKGGRWQKWGKGLPSVQIRDMKIQEDFDDLVLGTFGRSFWVLDDIEPLRALSRDRLDLRDTDLKVFDPGVAYLSAMKSYQGVRFVGQADFKGKNKPQGATFTIWKKPVDKKDKSVEKEKPQKDEAKAKNKAMGDKDKLTINVINGMDTLRTFKRKLKDGMNRITWRPDTKGVKYPYAFERKSKDEQGGMPIIPGTYKVVFNYGEHKDSTELTVASDPRIDKDIIDTEAKLEALQAYNKTVTMTTQAHDNLKEMKKSFDLYDKIIAAQPDSIQKEIKTIRKDIAGDIDSLLALYNLPKSKKEQYRDNSHTLTSKLGKGRYFLNTSLSEPSANGRHAVDKATKAADAVVSAVNEFSANKWKDFVDKIKALPLDELFKSYEEVKKE